MNTVIACLVMGFTLSLEAAEFEWKARKDYPGVANCYVVNNPFPTIKDYCRCQQPTQFRYSHLPDDLGNSQYCREVYVDSLNNSLVIEALPVHDMYCQLSIDPRNFDFCQKVFNH